MDKKCFKTFDNKDPQFDQNFFNQFQEIQSLENELKGLKNSIFEMFGKTRDDDDLR